MLEIRSALFMKIIVRVLGGLGNQLFAYAAGRRLSMASNAELILDDVTGFAHDRYGRGYQLDHFAIPCRKAFASERLEPMSRFRRKFLHTINRYRPFDTRTYVKQEGIDFDPRLLDLRPVSDIYLEGYWQSEKYFLDVESQIRLDLKIVAPTDHANIVCAKKISNNVSVAIHVRFFDKPDVERQFSSNNVPIEYYSKACEYMELAVTRAHYFLFSDRPEIARRFIPLPDDRVTVVSHNAGDEMAHADLWLMTQCQHFIISNSTFSWWGAWLASFPGKTVIAPDFVKKGGKTSWGFPGLLPESWRIV